MTGRPPKVPRETLEPMLSKLRGEGSTAKAIARGLGYSVDHIFKLCRKWGIKKQLKPIMTVDKPGASALEYSRDTTPSVNVPAGSGSDTGQLPEKGIS